MHSTPRSLFCALTALLALCAATSCSESQGASVSATASEPAGLPVVADLPLEAYRLQLLDLASAVASGMPMYPDLKARSRMQADVVAALLELDQPTRALNGIEQIADWRRGSGYADYAFYCAQRGELAPIDELLARAERISHNTDPENPQDWQADHIRSRIAATHLWLGQAGQALEFEADLEPSELGVVQSVRSQLLERDELDAAVDLLRDVGVAGTFEHVQAALESGVQLHRRFHADEPARERIEAAMQVAWARMPVEVRIRFCCELAESSLAGSNSSTALRWLDEACALLDQARWEPEDQVALMARLAELRFQAGDVAAAREQAAAAHALYSQQRARIVDIWRAGALRPLAQTFKTLGDGAQALELYKQAVDECQINPNSRPRAEDLIATCISMALRGIEPDADLWGRLISARDSLGSPW